MVFSSELILKVTSDGCGGGVGGSIDDSTMKIIIGATVGGVLLIVVCVACLCVVSRQMEITQEFERLRHKKKVII